MKSYAHEQVDASEGYESTLSTNLLKQMEEIVSEHEIGEGLEILLPEGETYRKWCILEDVQMCFRGYEVVKISVDIDEEQRLEGKATEIDRFLLELDMMQTPQLEFKCVELDECNKGFAEMKAQTKIIFKFKEDTAQ